MNQKVMDTILQEAEIRIMPTIESLVSSLNEKFVQIDHRMNAIEAHIGLFLENPKEPSDCLEKLPIIPVTNSNVFSKN